jgi:hypothetical protein
VKDEPNGWLVEPDKRPLAMNTANGTVQRATGTWYGTLSWWVAGRAGQVVWRCDHEHSTTGEANDCALKEWFKHHG